MEQLCRIRDDIELCYETFGDPSDPALLLIMGLGTQMIAWPDPFCAQLAGRGFHVVRFDNRDAGRSTHLHDHPTPTLRQLALRERRAAAYTLEDMADDAALLLERLGHDRAHVVGASMGGMIAQAVAIRHPRLTLSLTSIMSTTGNRLKGQPAVRLYPYFLKRPARTRQAAVARGWKLFKVIGSPGFEHDDAWLVELATRSYDRAQGDTRGTARQLLAIQTAADRTKDLRRVQAPTLVIHGTADKLVRPSGGQATARAIRGATLLMIPGMGHDLPPGAWPRIVDAITDNAARASAPALAQTAGD